MDDVQKVNFISVIHFHSVLEQSVTPTFFFKTIVAIQSVVFKIRNTPLTIFSDMQGDSKLLSGVPFIGHGNSDNNLESLCNVDVALNANP
jgi:hypothetical protein